MTEPLFSTELIAHLPKGMHLPDPFRAVLDWAEARGQRSVFRKFDAANFANHYVTPYPLAQMEMPGASYVLFNWSGLPHTYGWAQRRPEIDRRFIEIARISGDGGRLALWLDDSGQQRFVVLGHDALGTLPDDPIKVLQWLAMGYPEPGYDLMRPALSPQDAALANMTEPVLAPVDFQTFLNVTYGVDIPTRASELGIRPLTYYGTKTSDDPLVAWYSTVDPDAVDP